VECSTPLIIGMDLISNVGLAIDFASREYWTKEGHRFPLVVREKCLFLVAGPERYKKRI